MRVLARILNTFLVLFLVASCAAVPPEAIQLSEVVSKRTAAVQTSHEAFVAEYFKLSRERVEDYIRYKFTPQFMANFTRDAKLLELLTDNSIDDAERGDITVEFAEAAIKEIDKHRNEILAPLRDQEAKALKEIRASYADLQAMNASISGLLQSVSDVQVEQDALLAKLKLLEKRDKAVEQVTLINGKVLAAIDEGEAIDETLEKLKCIAKETCGE